MKKSLYVILPLLSLFIIYCLPSFYYLSFNPAIWPASTRGSMAMLFLISLLAGGALATFINDEDK